MSDEEPIRVSDNDERLGGGFPAKQAAKLYYDRLALQEKRFAQPVRTEELQNPLAVVDPPNWLGGNIRGQRVLCLAAGGGRQSALYAAAGGIVTVVDISAEMLRLDREVARAHSLSVTTIEGSMDDLSMLGVASFDLVIQPVSTCYVPDIRPVFREVARVMSPQGVYISQHKQPASLQISARPQSGGYAMTEPYYRSGPLPAEQDCLHRESGTLEYLHRWEEILGGMCRAGFVIEDLLEPFHARSDALPGHFGHRSQFVAPYVRIKARRIAVATQSILFS